MNSKQFVRVILQDEQRRFLVLQDKRNKLNLPGGKVDKDEHPEDAIVRETKEEIGVSITNTKLAYRHDLYISGEYWRGYFYTAVMEDTPTRRELDKHNKLEYKSINDIRLCHSIQGTLLEPVMYAYIFVNNYLKDND